MKRNLLVRLDETLSVPPISMKFEGSTDHATLIRRAATAMRRFEQERKRASKTRQ